MSQPYQGTRVLVLSPLLPSAYAAMMLADLGAEVITIWPAGLKHERDILGLGYMDRNKKCITLNLKTEKGREIAHRLAKEIDVVLEEFRPGAMKRLEMDYNTLKKINPSLIYCSISGYGQDGPSRDRPAHDGTFEGIAGLYSLNLDLPPDIGRIPIHHGIPVADHTSGLFATIGILVALQERSKNGKGQHVDVSMADACVSYNAWAMLSCLRSGAQTPWQAYPVEPATGVHKTKDDKYITLSHAGEDSLWRNLCRALGKPELAALPFAERVSRRDELTAMFREILLTRTRSEWVQLFEQHDVAGGPLLNVPEVIDHPHVRHRMIVETGDARTAKSVQIAHPVKYSETKTPIRSLPFAPGEHTGEILSGLGYSPEDVARFKNEGVAGWMIS